MLKPCGFDSVNGTSDFNENILIQVIDAIIAMCKLGNLRQDLQSPFFMFIMWEYTLGSQSPKDSFTGNGFGTAFNSSSIGVYFRVRRTMSLDPCVVLTQSPVTVSAASGD